jgi:hypothetical protein
LPRSSETEQTRVSLARVRVSESPDSWRPGEIQAESTSPSNSLSTPVWRSSTTGSRRADVEIAVMAAFALQAVVPEPLLPPSG